MSAYAAPVTEMRFLLKHIVDMPDITALPGYEDATPDLTNAVLDEAAKLAQDVIAPLNRIGDEQKSILENGVVRTPDGWKEAYEAYAEGGWNGLPFPPEWGGQGLPWALATPVQEMWQSSCLAFALGPLLTLGAVELLEAYGTPEQNAIYLENLVHGTWMGTMNLTEPQAGSDVGQVRTKATRREDGTYAIEGQKIYITYGDHELTENIIHMVLARTPDAPDGVKGISLFIVPKYLPKDDGTPGERNDVRTVGLESKLGIHASPTCVLAFGDHGGATGFLVGEECRGIEYMFVMMNNARLGVGLQGVAVAERAYQQAKAYAFDRVQSRSLTNPKGAPVPIVRHPDVRRMLLEMRALTEASRALTYLAHGELDRAKRSTDPDTAKRAKARMELLTPVVKAWSTDIGVTVASLGVQVHGGMGFIEDTGAAQHYRDARITPIYEGTNGIQANDLVFRKVVKDGGATITDFIDRMRATQEALADSGDDGAADGLDTALAALETATHHLLETTPTNVDAAAAAAVPYLEMVGICLGGWLLSKGSLAAGADLAAGEGDPKFLSAKQLTARFYISHILPRAASKLPAILDGADPIVNLDESWL